MYLGHETSGVMQWSVFLGPGLATCGREGLKFACSINCHGRWLKVIYLSERNYAVGMDGTNLVC